MRKILTIICLAVTFIIPPTFALALTIVDTGQPPTQVGGIAVCQPQWLAAPFTVAQPTTLTGIEGWLNVASMGDLTVAVYADAAGLPGPQLYIASALQFTTATTEWRGLLGLSWALNAPGAYWVAFEATGPTPLYATMPYGAPATPTQLAFSPNGGGNWQPLYWQLPVGVRVYGYSPVIPEPSTIILIGAGLVGLVGLRRTLKK